jgi:hypothetical protein
VVYRVSAEDLIHSLSSQAFGIDQEIPNLEIKTYL